MKTIVITLFVAALGLAQSQSTSSTTATPASKSAPKTTSAAQNKKPAKPAAPPKSNAQSQVQAIPAGATLVEPNLYRFTDSSGKTWNYRQTPFGISKWEETAAPAAQTAPAKSDPVVVTDLGDSYRFERKTPFGGSTWTRKKSELSDEERALAAGQQTVASKPAGNQ